MNQVIMRNRRTLRESQSLLHRHRLQIVVGPQHHSLTDTFALTFLPGDRTTTFNDRVMRRIGESVMVVLSYDEPRSSRSDRFAMPIRGLRVQANSDGSVLYGGEAGCRFLYDGALPPRPTARGQAINVQRNPSLVEQLLRLDRACKSHLNRHYRLTHRPRLPRIWLGFAPDQPPRFEDSPELRRRAAKEVGMPREHLGANGPVLLERLLEDVWQRHLILSTAPRNPTGLLLADAEMCTQARGALQIFEDFSELLGERTWNPVRGCEFPRFDNPAKQVLRQFNVDASCDFNQHFPDQLIERFEQAMREALGPMSAHFTQEEVLDGLTNPDQPLVAYATFLPGLRARLSPYVSQCTTDDDLLRAARKPADSLIASGAARIQVLAPQPANGSRAFYYDQETLQRRIEADLGEDAWQNAHSGQPCVSN